jgi:phosphotransferase system enzyme I (PtsI)
MLSNSLSQANLVKTEEGAGQAPSVFCEGIGVSAGVVIGNALVLGHDLNSVHEIELLPEMVEPEISRFRQALALSHRQLEDLKGRVEEALGEKEAAIFDAHMMLVADQVLVEEVIAQTRARRRNVEFIFHEVVERYTKALQNIDDSYIRDRLADIKDVASRVVRNLQGTVETDLRELAGVRIIIAHDLSPSETGNMDRRHVIAFATEIGSRTSHTAIMARSLGVPAVVGVAQLTDQVNNGDLLIVDGYKGQVIVRPDEALLEDYRARIRAQEKWVRNLKAEVALPSETIDGFRVQLATNIEKPEEVETVKQNYGVGIGLFRTEYLFINETTLPSEEQQFKAYRKVVEAILPRSVIFRTLDIGGDKFLSHFQLPSEMNPFLGTRAIRFCLAQPQIFMSQLRAILRASAYGKVRIMFPMVATLDELQAALKYLSQAKDELKAEGIPYNSHLDVGIMIEVPAAAMIADKLAPHVDFFSVGTNDLIQYSLAADRSNPDISYLYQPCHPSIIRLIRQVAHAAYAHGKWVGICGEMASDPVLVPLVLGLGIHELSMSPVAIAPVKRLIRHMKMHEAEALVRQSLQCSTAAEVLELCRTLVRRVAPDLLGE